MVGLLAFQGACKALQLSDLQLPDLQASPGRGMCVAVPQPHLGSLQLPLYGKKWACVVLTLDHLSFTVHAVEGVVKEVMGHAKEAGEKGMTEIGTGLEGWCTICSLPKGSKNLTRM